MKWEYKILSLPQSQDLKELNRLGDEGWEVVAMSYHYELILKRPKQHDSN